MAKQLGNNDPHMNNFIYTNIYFFAIYTSITLRKRDSYLLYKN